MEGLIDLELAADLDRKFFLAFLKGLTQIKFKSQLAKVEQAHSRGQAQGEQEDGEHVDLPYLYENLFAQSSISPEEFNTLTESTLRLVSEIVSLNMDKESLDKYLTRKVSAREDTKKAIQIFWKQERANIIRAVRQPTVLSGA